MQAAKIARMLRPIADEFLQPHYFVGWGTLALLNAGVAQGKQRSGLLWFILSIFFGPLATLVLVILPKR